MKGKLKDIFYLLARKPSQTVGASWPLRPSRPLMESLEAWYVLILWTLNFRLGSTQVHETVLNGQSLARQPSFSDDASWPLRPSRPLMESPEARYVLILWTWNFRHGSTQVHETVLNEQSLARQPSSSDDASWPLRPSRYLMESPEVRYVLISWTLNLRFDSPQVHETVQNRQTLAGQPSFSDDASWP